MLSDNFTLYREQKYHTIWKFLFTLNSHVHLRLPSFPSARNFTLIAKYLLVPGTDSSVNEAKTKPGHLKVIFMLIKQSYSKSFPCEYEEKLKRKPWTISSFFLVCKTDTGDISVKTEIGHFFLCNSQTMNV